KRYAIQNADGAEVINNELDSRLGLETFSDLYRLNPLSNPKRSRSVFEILRGATFVLDRIPDRRRDQTLGLLEIDSEGDVIYENAVTGAALYSKHSYIVS